MTETIAEGKKNLTEAEANDFVHAAEYAVMEEPLACCVDGRYAPDNAAAAAPGADAGKMMEALASLRKLGVQMTPTLREAAFDAVVRMAGGPEKFRFHSDAHAESTGLGCGHLRTALESPTEFGLDADDMQAIFARLEALKAGEVVLPGGHEEAAVIVVNDTQKGLAHQAIGKQAFVYHAGWDDKRIARLAAELAKTQQFSGLTEQAMRDMLLSVASEQRSVILRKLAKGLPMYDVGDAVVALGPME